VLVLEIEAQDRATHADVGSDADQLVAPHAEPFRPEGHDLHETDCGRGGHCVAVETTLHFDDTHDEARRQSRLAGSMGLAVDLFENVEPLVLILHDAPQPRLHECVPDRGVVVVCKAFGLPDGVLYDSLELGVFLLIGVRDADREQHGHAACRHRSQPRGYARARERLIAPSLNG
jgi:hypothetical protein